MSEVISVFSAVSKGLQSSFASRMLFLCCIFVVIC